MRLVIGTQIGQFLHGSLTNEDTLAPHEHSRQAMAIVRQLIIGKIVPNKLSVGGEIQPTAEPMKIQSTRSNVTQQPDGPIPT